MCAGTHWLLAFRWSQAGCPALFLDLLWLRLSQNFKGGGVWGLATCLYVCECPQRPWEWLSPAAAVHVLLCLLGCLSVSLYYKAGVGV